MATPRISSFSSYCFTLVFLLTLTPILVISLQQEPPELALHPAEQEAVYRVLDSVNSAIPWRTMYPDDLCSSAPHGVVCDYFFSGNGVVPSEPDEVHVTELSFGYVSDYTQNPPCSSNSTLNPLLFTSFKYLRKLFFYKCFTGKRAPLPDTVPEGFGSALEEMVFIENPALVGPLSGMIGNFTKLRRLVLTGNGLHGTIPSRLGDLVGLQEITLSRNSLGGGYDLNLTRLKNLKVLDLSHNFLDGNAPDSVGSLSQLLKLDLSYNGFSGKIPEAIGNLKKLEFLDISYNRFGSSGIPLFFSDMPRLREVYLSGNPLGGRIPEIWRNLGGILGIGLSGMALEGKIPASMGANLRNLRYLALDNNRLEGHVPEEFVLLELAGEINLENNNLSGRVPFSDHFRGKIGKKLKLGGNPGLCIGRGKSTAGSDDLGLWERAENSHSTHLQTGFSSSASLLRRAFMSIYSPVLLMGMVLAFI